MERSLQYNMTNLISIFGCRIRAQEILFILQDIKPVCRIELDALQLSEAEKFFKETTLSYLASTIQYDEKTESGDIPQATTPLKGMLLVYVSKNHSLAQEARIAETHFDHQRFGTLLGYPQCCVQFFIEHLEDAEKLHHDHTLISASRSVIFNPLLNISLQFFDWRIISHYPCHFNCPASVEQAERMLKAIERHDEELAEKIRLHLRTLVLYDDETGVHVFEGVGKRGNEYRYKSVLLTSPNLTHDLLGRGNMIKKVSHNHVEIHAGKEMIGEIKGPTFVLLDFLG